MNYRRRPGRRRRNPNPAPRRLERRRTLFIEPLEVRALLSGVSLTGVPNWVEQGPGPEINSGSTVTFPQKNEVGGAVQSIAVGANKLVIGTVNGGVWSTSDSPLLIGGGNPSWTPLTDKLPSLAIGAVAFDSTDAFGNTFYAGTGQFSNGFDSGGSAIGLYRTTDGGNNWTVLDGSSTTGSKLDGHRIKALIADGQTILAGAIDGDGISGSRDYVTNGGGLYRSADGGATFFKIVGAGANDLPAGAVTSLVLDPNNAQTVYAAVSGQGVFRSNNLGAAGSWTSVNTGLTTVGATTTDIELTDQTIAGGTTLFAGVENDATNKIEVFTSTNSGNAWTQLAAVPASFPQPGLGAFAEKLNIVADPTNAGVVYIDGMGGTGIFRYNPAGAGSWVRIDGAGNTAGGTAPHPDSRDMAFLSGVLVEADDGGIVDMANPTNATASDWISLNNNLRTFEFYSVAYDSTNHVIIGGVQDNGSPSQAARNTVANWTDLSGGDGQFQAVDTTSLGGGNVYRYSMSDDFAFLNRTRFDNTNTQVGASARVGFRSSIGAANLTGLNAADQAFAASGAFSQVPFALNSQDPTRMLIGFNGVYEDAGASVAAGGAAGDVISDITSNLAGLSGKVSAVAYGGQRAGTGFTNVALVGSTSGQLYFRGETGSTFTRVDGAGAGQLGGSGKLWSVALDPNDWRHVFVVKGNQLFETKDITNLASKPFQVIGGGAGDNLLNVTSQLRSVIAVDVGAQTVPLVTGQGGLFRSLAPGQWTQYGERLPDVVGRSVVYNSTDNVVVLGTFGRGVWTIPNATSSLMTQGVLTITGDQDFAGENDTFRMVRDVNNPAFVHVFVNGVEDASSPFQLATIHQINVNGLDGNDTLVIDDSNGLINVPGGIHYDGGTGRNTLQIVQTGGATETSDVYSVGPNNGEGSDVIVGATGTQTIQFQNLAPVLDTVPATTATVNGTPADNAINYTTGSIVANGLITIDNQESYEFSNKTNLVVNGGAGSDTINLNNQAAAPTGLTSITANGGDPTASDTLIVNGIAGVADDLQATPTGTGAGTVSDTPAPTFVPLTFSGIEHLTVVGQLADADGLDISSTAGNDAYTYVPGATGDSGLVTGTANGLSFDITPVAFSGFRSFVTPLAFNSGGTDSLTLDGTVGNDVVSFANQAFPLGGTSPAATVNGSTPLFYSSGLVHVVLNGLTGNETFNLTGDGSAATVLLSSTGATITGGGLAPGAAPLTITGAGVVNFNNGAGAITVGGTANADSVDVTPTGASSAAIQVSASSPVLNATTTGTLMIGEATPDNDTVTIHASGSADSIDVDRGASLTTQTVQVKTFLGGPLALKMLTLTGPDFASLVIDTGLGNDTVNVTNTVENLLGTVLSVVGASSHDVLNVTNTKIGPTSIAPGASDDSGQITSGDGAINFAGARVLFLSDSNNDPLTVFGTSGDDTVTAAKGAIFDTASVNARARVQFAGFGTLTLDGNTGNDSYNVSPLTLTGVTGINVGSSSAGGSDTLTVNGSTAGETIRYNQSAAQITVAASAPITTTNISSVAINGQGGGDTLAVTTPASSTTTLMAGTAIDSGLLQVGSLAPLTFSGLGALGTLSISDAGGTLIYNGTANNDSFNVSGAAGSSGNITASGRIAVSTSGVTGLTLNGGDGDDTFNITGSAATPLPYTAINLDGGNPSASDIVTLTGATGPVAVNLGDSSANPPTNTTVTGYGPTVTLSGVEVVNLDTGANTLTVNGTTGNDTLAATPTGANSVSFQSYSGGTAQNGQGGTLSSLTPITPAFNATNVSGVAGGFAIDANGGSDTLFVEGSQNADSIDVNDAVSGANAARVAGMLAVNYNAALPQVEIDGLAGSDTINVAPSTTTSFLVDGGDPIGVQPGDTINLLHPPGSYQIFAGPTKDSGGLKTPSMQAVSWAHIETIVNTGGGAPIITGTNDNDEITVIARDNSYNPANPGTPNPLLDGVQDFTVSVNDSADMLFVNTPDLLIDGLSGNDDIVVREPAPNQAAWNVQVFVAGGAAASGNNRLGDNIELETPGTQSVTYNPNNPLSAVPAVPGITLSVPGAGGGQFSDAANTSTITAMQFLVPGFFQSSPGGAEDFVYAGEGGDDSLTYNTPANAGNNLVYTPGATPDAGAITGSQSGGAALTPLSFSGLGTTGSLAFTTSNAGRTDHLNVEGVPTSAGESFSVAAAGGGTVQLSQLPPASGVITLPITTASVSDLELDGLGGNDQFSLAGTLPYTNLIVDDGAVVNLSGAAGPVTVNLGDSAAAPPTDTTITGYGGMVTLTGVEVANLDAGGNGLTVNGTAASDQLSYTPTGAAAGAVTNAGLNTTFNFTNAAGTFTLDPAGGNDTVTVNGTSASDTINVVRGAATTVQVNALKTVSLATANTEALVVATGSGADRVNVSGTAGPASLTVNGGAAPAVDTLIVTNSTAGTTTVVPGATPDAGTVQTPDGNVGFTGMTLVTLAGAAASDTLVAKGTNSADNLALQFLGGANRIWVNSQAVVSFSSFGAVTLQGLFGDDKFSVTPVGLVGVTAINVAGGDPTASDSLLVTGTTGADAIVFAPTAADAATVTVNAAAPIAFSTTEALTINGLGGGDTLAVTTPAGPDTITYSPGATVDSASVQVGSLVPLNFNNLGAGSVRLADTGGAADSLVYNGTAASDTFNVVGAAGGTITLNSQLPVQTPGIANLTLNGLAGDDTFNLTGALPYTATTLDGGDPSGSDIANLTGAAGPVTVNLGDSAAAPPTDTTITGYGGMVTLTGVEVANLDAGGNGLTVNGTAASDQLSYTPTGAAAGAVTNAGLNTTFNFTNAAGTFTLDPAGGNDTVTVNGTSASDTINVVRGAATTVQVNALKTVSLATANTEALVVATGSGTDRVNVSGTAGPASLTVNGGAVPAADTLTVTNSTAGTTTVVPGATPDAGTVQTPDGNVGFTGMTLVTLAGAAASDTLVAKGTNSADNMALQFLGGANRIWVNSQAVVSFSSFGAVTLQGLFGDDKFSVIPVGLVGVTAINVAGGDPTASDSLLVTGTTGADAIVFAPTAADAGTVTVNAAAPIAFSTTESVTINGLGGGDTLAVTTPAGLDTITYSPGATVDSASVQVGSLVPLSFNNLGAGSVRLADTGGAADSLVYNGTAASDTFNVVGAAGGTITLNSQLPVQTPGIANLTLNGLAGDDTFNLTGALPYVATRLDGGDPSGSDIANLTGAVANVAVNLGDSAASPPTNTTITGYGGIVTLAGVEVANLNAGGNGLTAIGTARNDTITYTPTGAAAGTFTSAGLNTTFNFSAATGAFTLFGGAGSANQVKVNGTEGRDLFSIDAGTGTVSVTDASGTLLKPVVLGIDVQILSAFGLGGQNTFQVTPAAGLQFAPKNLDNLLINVDGGSAGQNNALVIQAAGGGSLAADQFVVDNRDVIGSSGTIRTFTAAVQWPDINYTNVKVVSPNMASPGNLLVLGPDGYEPNESQPGAAILGSAATVQVSHASIFPDAAEFPGVPADNDFYSVLAQQTGTLDLVATFRLFAPTLLPGGGNLNLQALDAAGNIIATASGGAASFGAVGATANARIRIPVVAGQTYVLHVFGANANGTPNGAVVNGYDLSIVDTPTIVPFNIELSRSVAAGVAGAPDAGDLPTTAPGDDTGRSQLDDVTNNNKPRIYLRLADGVFLNDLPGNGTTDAPPVGVIPIPFSPNAATPGFRVAIFDGDNTQTPVGFASQVAGFPGLYSFDFPAALADGVHHLTAEVQMVDPAAPNETGFGGASLSLNLTIDTAVPPIAFGTGVAGSNSGLDGASDSGIGGQPATIVDRITNVSTPTFYGVAEANAIVRLYDDMNNNGMVDAGDVYLGQTTASPLDGTNQFPGGQWRLTSNVDLNNPKLGFALDGVRHLLASAEDLAGNLSPVQSLTIFVDTQGPKVKNVGIAGSPAFNLFLNKPSAPSPTPLVNALDVTFSDQPVRVGPDFVYPAVNPILAGTIGNYVLLGEHTGPVAITSVTFADSTASGTPGMSVATLHFAAPLADDRYTLSISDHISDNAGNPLDGEFNGATFPSGNGTSGGTLVGSFTIDSRPEIGVYSAGTVGLDINGNGAFDPQNANAQNRDAVITLGYPSDRLFSGKFADAGGVVNGFDKLAAYGFVNGQWRWLYDQGGLGNNEIQVPQAIGLDGLPVAGNWTNTKGGADHVGVFTGDTWWLDVLGQGSVTPADLATPATAVSPAGKLASDMVGLPIVGDFDGDGKVDLGAYQNGVFEFDLSSLEVNGVVTGQWNAKINVQPLLPNNIGFAGVLARPVAADMNADGTTDLGLYWPGRTDSNPGTAQWYFLVSDPAAATAAAKFASLNQTFQDETLGGRDIYYQFGDQFALPLVGNFDPPSSGAAVPNFSSTAAAADWISRLYVQILGREPSTGDLANWISQINQGATADQVAQSFVDSAEHRGQVIDQLYQQYLGRHADSDGVAFWTSVWNAAGGPELVQAGIIGSPEYYATAGKLNPSLSADAAWVTALYRNILGRDVDQQGLSYWVDYIQSHSKQSVVLGFVTSDEYRLQLIDGWFETYLGRALDASGAAYWLHQMQQGLGQDQIVIGILSSDEYRNRA
jgi:hypothetical protein